MKTATSTLKASLAVWIQNQRTVETYPDNDRKAQALFLNNMRIEAGIAFLHNPLRSK